MSKVRLFIVVCVLFFSSTFPVFALDKTKNENRPEFYEVEPNVRLHVTDLGPENGKTIVFLHGYLFTDAMFEYQYQYFVDKGYRVIGITFRGSGLSSKPGGNYSLEMFADDVEQVLEQTKVNDVTLVGFSLGSFTAAKYAAKYQTKHISKLVLISTGAVSIPLDARKQWRAVANQGAKDKFGLITKVVNIAGQTDDWGTPILKNWLIAEASTTSLYAAVKELEFTADIDLRKDVPNIRIPVAIFHSRYDRAWNFDLVTKEWLSFLKNKPTIVQFEQSGHAIPLQEPERLNQELLKFIEL
jgi:pimeloyl-ACP methyl ester carboxylesterase